MVDYVSPDGITVALDTGAPESIALNTGVPRPFPRVNGYLLIPVDDAFLVGQVEWLAVGASSLPKRQDKQRDSGLVDLPYPLRKLRLNPLGTIRRSAAGEYTFSRGADALPTVGVAVVLPTKDQLQSIIESGEHRWVKIGTSPLADHADVYIDPDRLFGRHLAVLGNTGSGKSCSVAGLIRWSLEQARDEQAHAGKQPNARFIVLDPNGEYSHVFSDNKITARVFKVNQTKKKSKNDLKVPLWFWNSAEWCAFTKASAKMQRPTLMRALREVKAGRDNAGDMSEEEKKLRLRRLLSSNWISIQASVNSNEFKEKSTKCGYMLKAIGEDVSEMIQEFPAQGQALGAISSSIDAALEQNKSSVYYNSFNNRQITQITDALQAALNGLGGVIYQKGPDEDVPIKFDGADLADHLEILAQQGNISQFLDPLVARIRTLLSDAKMKAIVSDTGDITLESWLNDYIGNNEAKNGCVSVIDLSLVPSEVVHVVTAVIARMVFEAQQRYMKENKVSLPTVIVMEEAHTFVKRYKDDVEDHGAAGICCQAFEKIAREGRKFGLGLVLSSQRPSELSPTVLSQCNSFLLHRISNDRDQDRVQRMVPDNLQGVLRELPLLPSQNAILLGWASELPVLVRMTDLPKGHRPRSDDPDFWDVWAGNKPRKINWKSIADEWQRVPDKNKEAGEP